MTVLGFGRMGACEVLDPRKPISPAFLTISGPTVGPYSVVLANGDFTLDKLIGASEAPWSIILNLVQYFKPLRGTVSAVSEHGFVKIELSKKER